MTHQLMLEIPDEVYQPLLYKAQEMGQSIEAVAGACLAQSVVSSANATAGENALPGNRLRKWAGAFASGVPDLATRHHEYLGQALSDELQGRKDA